MYEVDIHMYCSNILGIDSLHIVNKVDERH
jgi:hypothetical protein